LPDAVSPCPRVTCVPRLFSSSSNHHGVGRLWQGHLNDLCQFIVRGCCSKKCNAASCPCVAVAADRVLAGDAWEGVPSKHYLLFLSFLCRRSRFCHVVRARRAPKRPAWCYLPHALVHFLCEWEGVRWCYSEKFTIFRAICVTIRWNWSLGAGASFVMDKTKKFGFFEPPFGAESRGNFGGLWCFLCKFYSENFTIFRAISVIFFGNWLLRARATFRL